MRNRELTLEKAKETKKGQKNKYNYIKDENWRQEIVSLNEALQHLTKRKDKSDKVMQKFKSKSRESALITKALGAFTMESNLPKKEPWELKNDSKKAQELAKAIEASIEGYGARDSTGSSISGNYDILEVMEDLLDDFDEDDEHRMPPSRQSRERITSTGSDSDKTSSYDNLHRRTKSLKEKPIQR